MKDKGNLFYFRCSKFDSVAFTFVGGGVKGWCCFEFEATQRASRDKSM